MPFHFMEFATMPTTTMVFLRAAVGVEVSWLLLTHLARCAVRGPSEERGEDDHLGFVPGRKVRWRVWIRQAHRAVFKMTASASHPRKATSCRLRIYIV